MADRITRRGVLAGSAACLPTLALAQGAPKPALGTPRSVISEPPREFGPRAAPSIAPIPMCCALDPSFRGPADRPGSHPPRFHRSIISPKARPGAAKGNTRSSATSRTTRSIATSGRPARSPPSASPPSTPTATASIIQGRQLTCQDFFRRVVRWEVDGSMTVLADNFEGKPFNSPNDLAPHKDGSVWFTDPHLWRRSGGRPSRRRRRTVQSRRTARSSHRQYRRRHSSGGMHQLLPANVYRWDPSGKVEVVLPFETGLLPNGICFSPDYGKVYIIRGGSIFVG